MLVNMSRYGLLDPSLMIEAVALLAKRKISELPVVDAAGQPVGLIDVTDVVGLLPAEESAARFAGSICQTAYGNAGVAVEECSR